ncbi:hypothetical protein [Polaromonas sp. JS666]|uniref:hypothetical protein n=1 Tax=Polaromonas sp. (strain JS666 / ATCC BAA-500) TaxID=296591 RepID=UPI0008802F66|nr:hypothetical protein [Polaromonas sp. JS666]SDN20923.1 hypothetical protein SAMN05720382_10442 [Polaromonas sp. JS666]
MNLPSNTPPDGDFVAYVERLTHANAHASAEAREDRLKPGEKAAPRTSPTASIAKPSAQSAKPAPVAATVAAFATHVKWVVILWIATQVLSEVVPGTGFLFLPALLVYGAWAVWQANRRSSGALLQRLRELARQAAEEAEKAQKNQPSKKK